MNPVFIVFARDREGVMEKIEEIEEMGLPYRVVCGEKMEHSNVYYREPRGKWDAVNFSTKLLGEEHDVVLFNDVDTRIHGLENAIEELEKGYDLVYCRVEVEEGPQRRFYGLMDFLRDKLGLHVAASGELMVLNKEVLEEVTPVPPCLAEDSYMLFKALELGYRASFCSNTFVETERTSSPEEEISYKERTTHGIYQALEQTSPPLRIRLFYRFLPYFAHLLVLAGEDGRAWLKGIKNGYRAHKNESQEERKRRF